MTLRVKTKTVKCAEVNFLCVHKKLRSKRLTPVLIREITRRCNVVNVWQAIYTAGVLLPTPVSTCRYFHRSLDWQKLYEVNFSPLPAGSTPQRQVLKYKLPSNPQLSGVRPMKRADIPSVSKLLKRYLDTMQIAQVFNEKEFSHWMLNEETPVEEQVVYPYVVEQNGKITDFFSFYRLESTIIGNAKHNTMRVAYLYYYASEAALKGGKDKAELKKRLNELMHDALILAKKVGDLVVRQYAAADTLKGQLRRLQRIDIARQPSLPQRAKVRSWRRKTALLLVQLSDSDDTRRYR
jgi:glycylpeptide N-tetradecanoyltransferase